MKALVVTAALMFPVMALAQDAAPAPAVKPAAASSAKPKRAPTAAKPAQTTPEVLGITQIIGIRQIDPATYEIDARTEGGNEIHLRMNAFVMQNLGMQLGTYGK